MSSKIVTSNIRSPLTTENRLYVKSQPQKHSVQKVFFKFITPICGVNFSNNISITKVRVNERKTNLTRTLKPLNHLISILHDLIISPHVKHSPINLPQYVSSPMQSFFAENVSLYFVGESGDTMMYLHIFFHFLKFHP